MFCTGSSKFCIVAYLTAYQDRKGEFAFEQERTYEKLLSSTIHRLLISLRFYNPFYDLLIQQVKYIHAVFRLKKKNIRAFVKIFLAFSVKVW